MTRIQILLDQKEVQALRSQAKGSGKSCSQLVREAIDNVYVSRFSDKQMAQMAREAKLDKRLKRFKNLQAARGYLWSL